MMMKGRKPASLPLLLLIHVISLVKFQALIDLLHRNLDIQTTQLDHLVRAITVKTPRLGIVRVLLVTLPDLNKREELTYQHNFLNGWTILVCFELDTPIPALC